MIEEIIIYSIMTLPFIGGVILFIILCKVLE